MSSTFTPFAAILVCVALLFGGLRATADTIDMMHTHTAELTLQERIGAEKLNGGIFRARLHNAVKNGDNSF